jgi:hypothetical protein
MVQKKGFVTVILRIYEGNNGMGEVKQPLDPL